MPADIAVDIVFDIIRMFLSSRKNYSEVLDEIVLKTTKKQHQGAPGDKVFLFVTFLFSHGNGILYLVTIY